MSDAKNAFSGGGFLIAEADPARVCTPEDFSDDQLAMRDSAAEFVAREVLPHKERLDTHADDTLELLMSKFGQQGFLGIEIPEALGGLGLDLVTSVLVFEGICYGGYASFGATAGAHCGIGTWPILFFGNDAQRARYLPEIIAGTSVAAYALTEPASGSDALSAKMRAEPSEDGSEWILNGQKAFITNAGIADVFTVFAKVAGKNACFLVERGAPGFTVGREERKLGIHGSSTCALSFEDVRIPKGNLLGEIGKGHKIVMNTLNLGRLKLAAGSLGGLKLALETAVRYADGRKQFGRPLHAFDATRRKIADMAVAGWVGESMVYRTAGALSEALHGASGDAALEAIGEYEMECAIVKAALSESFWAVADETLQLHGGYGYVEDYPAAQFLRDARINRIFEGTNEICRLHVAGTLIRRGLEGRLDLNLIMPAKDDRDWGDPATLGGKRDAVRQAVRLLLPKIFQHVVRKYKDLRDMRKAIERALVDDQQTLMDLADLVMLAYAMDSSLLRLRKMQEQPRAAHAYAVVSLFFEEALVKAAGLMRRIQGDLGDADGQLRALDQLLSRAPLADVAALRRVISAIVVEDLIR